MRGTAAPLGGPLATRPLRVLLALAGVGAGVAAWRPLAGLGPVTGLNDGFPWGL